MAYTRPSYMNFICDDRTDVSTLPTQTTPGAHGDFAPFGARALIIDDNGDGSAVVMLNSMGVWKDLSGIGINYVPFRVKTADDDEP